nr:MAG TPA: hypothetical protein [Caudoviricetes sp.]
MHGFLRYLPFQSPFASSNKGFHYYTIWKSIIIICKTFLCAIDADSV